MRKAFWISLYSVFSLTISVICPTNAAAAPSLQPLGQISEGLSVPTRIDIDGAGNLYVADPRQKKVFVYDKFGKTLAGFAVEGLSGGGLAVTADGQTIYAACGQAVQIINGKNGQPLGQLGSATDTFTAIGFIDIGADGSIYVADTGQRHILVFSSAGALLHRFGDPASPSGQFASIFALAVDPANFEIYVADSVRNTRNQAKVMVFSPQGVLLRTLASSDETVFATPAPFFFGGITFDGQGHGYFLDSYRSDVRIVQLPQAFQSRVPIPELLPGNMERPVDAAFDPLTNRLFVACDGGRVEVFGLNGAGNPNLNNPPGLPVLLEPIAGSETDTATPQLVFLNAEDSENDVLSYDVRLFHAGELVVQYNNLPQYLPNSFAQVDRNLTENAGYQWSVRAGDGRLSSDWTEQQSFYVNAVQEAPDAPTLLGAEETPVLDGASRLAWLASNDPDPYDTVSYRVEVLPADAPLEAIAVLDLAVTSTTLAELDGYAALKDGQSYLWQVAAVDNHQLASAPSEPGRFFYDTTVLRVDADVAGAKVYLGGNHAYPGRYLGATPLEVRDLPVGAAAVVIESAGFETVVRQFALEAGSNLDIHVTLTPAPQPDFKSKRKIILATGQTDLAPFFIDFDHDGRIDLLAGGSNGSLLLYPGESNSAAPLAFGEGIPLDVPLVPGAAPFVADWDNDGRKDLLIGGADGTVSLLLNTGTATLPAFDNPVLLQAAGSAISVAGPAKPLVLDLDGDLNKDLMVGTGNGDILYFRNLADDARPELAAGRAVLTVNGTAAPFAVDWNGDGARDLLVAEKSGLRLFLRSGTGETFTEAFPSLPEITALPAKGRYDKAADSSEAEWTPAPFVFDADNMKGKDVLIGTREGNIELFRSHAKSKQQDKIKADL